MQHRMGHAAEQEVLDAPPAMGPQDHQVGLARRLRDTTGRVAAPYPRRDGGEEIPQRSRSLLHKLFGILFDLPRPFLGPSPEGLVAGVSPVLVEAPPDEPAGDGRPGERRRGVVPARSYGALARVARGILRADDIFVPYDARYPERPIPEAVRALPTARIRVMHGARMTFRRASIAKERFAEILERYAAGEDSDASYRVSRHGVLVNAHRAKLCHLEASGGRLSRHTVCVLGAMNPIVLHRLHAPDQASSRNKRSGWRSNSRPNLPQVRAPSGSPVS